MANLSYSAEHVADFLDNIGQVANEDCLTLNIWTKPQTGADLKPVMVWTYGGSFDGGGTNTSGYSGQYWSNTEDVVFVTFNYRLGVFGFPGAPDLTQNVAMLDQRLALEWIRDNIEAFGGDPGRITLFGQSAGAGMTDYYTYIWLDDPIIAGAIMESGSASGPTGSGSGVGGANLPPSNQTAKWYELSRRVGCGDNTTQSAQAVIGCMRNSSNVTMEALLANTPTGAPFHSVFGPTIDDKTVFENYTARVEAGNLIKKPVLVGNNDDELAVYTVLNLSGSGINIPTSGLPQAQLKQYNTFLFGCPSNVQAQLRWSQKIPVWRYRYFPSFPNIAVPKDNGLAYHGAEIWPMFGTDQEVGQAASTDIERTVGSYVRSAWATFARCPESGLSDQLGWPQYTANPNATGLVLLGKDAANVAEFGPGGAYDDICAQLPQLLATGKLG
ncbi:hypothetical protein PRZ48_005445 [Zasmidium cellare]|uniref:Carboxylic ester hydrolase n=1 Tax=Zasmidium cellare TaxID=395010 RepID=A0ABR0ESD4_ZASCE|nr:hypothetical protein PRZ48_005445 [Zasmidium cellare]